MEIVTDPRWPGRWVVLAEWFGTIVPVFESDPRHDAFTQIADCQDFVRSHEGS
jgi:hypothetical protein